LSEGRDGCYSSEEQRIRAGISESNETATGGYFYSIKIKNMRKIKRAILLMLIFIAGACSGSETTEKNVVTDDVVGEETWTIHRGINLSYWLSQNFQDANKYPYGNISRYARINEATIKLIADAGFDHVRFPLDEVEMWNTTRMPYVTSFDLMHKVIGWCIKYKLRVLVDLHIIRSHNFSTQNNKLWTDVSEQDWLVEMWRQLTNELKKYSTGSVAYEFLNEPVIEESRSSAWNALLSRLITTIRPLSPNRKFFVGPNRWQGIDFLSALSLPKDDNLILSVHFYEPMLLTHYKASWLPEYNVDGVVSYPGMLLSHEDVAKIPAQQYESIKYMLQSEYNRAFLYSRFKKAVDYAKSKNLPIYLGEFGCIIENVPILAREQWYKDIVSVLDELRIPYSVWDLYGAFSVFESQSDKPIDEVILSTLTKGNN